MTDAPKPTWERSPADLVARFAEVMDGYPDLERRKMFGYPAAFLGGNMVTGLHGPRWVLRLAEADRAELLAAGGAVFEPMPGRPMKGFAVLPAATLTDDAALGRWLARAIDHAASLPAKEPGRRAG